MRLPTLRVIAASARERKPLHAQAGRRVESDERVSLAALNTAALVRCSCRAIELLSLKTCGERGEAAEGSATQRSEATERGRTEGGITPPAGRRIASTAAAACSAAFDSRSRRVAAARRQEAKNPVVRAAVFSIVRSVPLACARLSAACVLAVSSQKIFYFCRPVTTSLHSPKHAFAARHQRTCIRC